MSRLLPTPFVCAACGVAVYPSLSLSYSYCSMIKTISALACVVESQHKLPLSLLSLPPSLLLLFSSSLFLLFLPTFPSLLMFSVSFFLSSLIVYSDQSW
eukprot:m.140130 g.140130  ORF g.140130 m.140130 type:complete len:99 (-) comp15958_c5_seq8:1153-1449(-)